MGDKQLAFLPTGYKEYFKQQFPYYLSIGMTYDQYWNQDVCLVEDYRKAAEIIKERKNYELWLQGMYVFEAVCDASPLLHAFAKSGTKAIPYSNRPYAVTQKEIKAREIAKLREAAYDFGNLVVAKNEERQKKQEASADVDNN